MIHAPSKKFITGLTLAALLTVPALAASARHADSPAKIRIPLDYDPVKHTKSGEVVATLENPQGFELIYAVNEPAKLNGICYEGKAEDAALILERMVETFKGNVGKDLRADEKEVIDREIDGRTVPAIRVKVSEILLNQPQRDSWYLPGVLGARPCK